VAVFFSETLRTFHNYAKLHKHAFPALCRCICWDDEVMRMLVMVITVNGSNNISVRHRPRRRLVDSGSNNRCSSPLSDLLSTTRPVCVKSNCAPWRADMRSAISFRRRRLWTPTKWHRCVQASDAQRRNEVECTASVIGKNISRRRPSAGNPLHS